MTAEVTWIPEAQRRPICDVPWLGNSVVLADGSVNFCCFSSAVVGNVNQHSFGEIWRGKTMQRIRRALTNQTLPPECQSTSCPMYRGDDRHYILDRMDGPNGFRSTGTHDPHKEIRERLKGSTASFIAASTAEPAAVCMDFRIEGSPMYADLVVAITQPNGKMVFLPDNEPYAVPLRSWMEIRQQDDPVRIYVHVDKATEQRGNYTLCAALFQCEENPNLLSNCYWSATVNFTVA